MVHNLGIMNLQYNSDYIFKIGFNHFWSGFDNRNNFITRLFEYSKIPFEIVDSEYGHLDILIESSFNASDTPEIFLFNAIKHYLINRLNINIFGKHNQLVDKVMYRKTNSPFRIYYTGENVRAPNNYDLSLSFDVDDPYLCNFYYPLIYDTLLSSKMSVKDEIFGSVIPFDYLTAPRPYANIGKRKLACIFINNHQPFRERLIREFSRYGQVDVFGKAYGNFIDRKSDLFGEYKYVLCPENDFYPGYVTEKIVHAFALGSIPVYWGSNENIKFLNKNSFIAINPYISLSKQIEIFCSSSQKDVEKVYRQPLILEEPGWDDITRSLLERMINFEKR